MAIVTGNYLTVAGTPLPAGAVPQIGVLPSKNAVTVNGQLIATREQTVTPNATTGAFSINLIPTVDVIDGDFHYWLRGYYLLPDAGHSVRELFRMKIQVPTGGGRLDELTGGGVPSKGWTIVSLTEPPVVIVGAGWLHADPNGDPNLGTGIYYEGEA